MRDILIRKILLLSVCDDCELLPKLLVPFALVLVVYADCINRNLYLLLPKFLRNRSRKIDT